jgi:hypothetical protein
MEATNLQSFSKAIGNFQLHCCLESGVLLISLKLLGTSEILATNVKPGAIPQSLCGLVDSAEELFMTIKNSDKYHLRVSLK